MQTIEAYEKDILLQIKFLKKIKLEKTLSETSQKNTIFCGTGDSFVASLLAEALSNNTVRAADPLDLLKNKSLSKNKTVYLISLSGNTISNIKVAKKIRKTIAITSNAKSPYAKTVQFFHSVHQFPIPQKILQQHTLLLDKCNNFQ